MMTYDVAVIGGGPAGAVAATLLARQGSTVILIERTHFQRPRPGEFLSPLGRHELAAAQLLDSIPADAWAPSPGILSCWHDDIPRSQDFILSPYGEGWRLDRCKFDAALCHTAVTTGAQCISDSTVLHGAHEAAHWNLQVRRHASIIALKSRFLLVTTGRSGLSGITTRRQRSDQQIALLGVSDSAEGLAEEPRLLLEALPNSWCYALALPSGGSAAAVLTDADLLPPGNDRCSQFREMLQHSRLVWPRIAAGIADTSFHKCIADSSHASPCPQPGVLVAGDALSALDPLSGNGIAFAIRTASRAVHALLRHMEGESLDEYKEFIREEQIARTRQRISAYNLRRFPDSIFWQRRRYQETGLYLHQEAAIWRTAPRTARTPSAS